jgi:hypothetical protein
MNEALIAPEETQAIDSDEEAEAILADFRQRQQTKARDEALLKQAEEEAVRRSGLTAAPTVCCCCR